MRPLDQWLHDGLTEDVAAEEQKRQEDLKLAETVRERENAALEEFEKAVRDRFVDEGITPAEDDEDNGGEAA